MIIGIDASNIISGGGLTHLVEILRAVDLDHHGIERMDVWAPQNTLDKIERKEGINLKSHPHLESNLIRRIYWQRTVLMSYAEKNYDILFVPGGSYIGSFRPFVTMNRNMMPFDLPERKKYGLSSMGMRLILLEKVQAFTYRLADGIIFLSKEANRVIEKTMEETLSGVRIIPHGIASKFFQEPKEQKSIKQYNDTHPFRFLYVSTITIYKHQWQVIEAIKMLRDWGYPVVLDLVGSITTKKGGELFTQSRKKHDPKNQFVFYHGKKNQAELLNFYHQSDGAIFASSCETFGQILLESMASGLPIACSDRSAMPEILNDRGEYFNPESPVSIARALKKLLDSAELRQKMATGAYQKARTHSWKRCAKETFDFIHQVYKKEAPRTNEVLMGD